MWFCDINVSTFTEFRDYKSLAITPTMKFQFVWAPGWLKDRVESTWSEFMRVEQLLIVVFGSGAQVSGLVIGQCFVNATWLIAYYDVRLIRSFQKWFAANVWKKKNKCLMTCTTWNCNIDSVLTVWRNQKNLHSCD